MTYTKAVSVELGSFLPLWWIDNLLFLVKKSENYFCASPPITFDKIANRMVRVQRIDSIYFIFYCFFFFTFLGYLKKYLSYSALKNLKSIFKERLNCHNRYSINKTTLCLGACVSSMNNHVIRYLLIHYGSVNQNDHMIAYLLILLSLVITNGLVAY